MAAITARPKPAHKGVTGALVSVKGADAAAGVGVGWEAASAA